ncbi:MAG: ABC transporter permease subunit [Anaerolineae bacterium]|nr:ABC transporter permease subunit [Anaerolineae bacterium]
MPGVFTVFQREIGSYFTSLYAYLIAFAILIITGILFITDLDNAAGQRPPDPSVIPTFLSFAMIFFAPLLTMRLLAEEKREGTLELLLTSPASDTGIVVGKFLGSWAYFTLILAITFIYQIILIGIAQPDLVHAISAYLGIWLYGGACLAVGMVFSAITENQIVAAFLASAILFLLWIGDRVGQVVTNIDFARVLRELTLQGHFSTSFAYGLLHAEDVVYFAGIIVVMLFITIRLVESNRWR